MRVYSVWVDDTKMIEVQADNLSTNSGGDEGQVWWNFSANQLDGAAITVAAFPFTSVKYIVSRTA